MIGSLSFAHHIEIFTLHDHEVFLNGEKARVCYLDDLTKLESQIGARLDDSMGSEAVNRVMTEFEPRITQSIDCQKRAMQLKVEKLPAIVIDTEYVTYGLNSVNHALSVYQQEDSGAQ